MKIIDAAAIDKIHLENDKVAGTPDYNKFRMCTDVKTNGVWKFIGWSVPHTCIDGTVKRFKDKEYLIIADTRYELRDVHKELLGIT